MIRCAKGLEKAPEVPEWPDVTQLVRWMHKLAENVFNASARSDQKRVARWIRMPARKGCSFEKVKRTPERVRDHHGKMISEQSYYSVTGVTVIFLSCEVFFLNVETRRVWMGDE